VSCLKWTDINLMDTDHAQPLKVIKAKLIGLAQLMTNDPAMYDQLDRDANAAGINPSPVAKYFIPDGAGANRSFVLNQEGLVAYSHNLNNLVKMCKACNQGAGKHAGGLAEWLAGNRFYGPAFAATFPSGLRSSRIGDQNASGQSASQAIYGQVKDVYLPALQSIYPAHQLNQFLHHKVTSTKQKQEDLALTPISPARGARSEELEDRGRKHELTALSTQVLLDYAKKKNRAKVRGKSPQREAQELKERLDSNEERRRAKRRREEPDFPEARKKARWGTPTDPTHITDVDTKEMIEQANMEGLEDFEQDRQAGTTEALFADLKADPTALTSPEAPGYRLGFNTAFAKRVKASQDGYADGQGDRASTLPPDEPDSALWAKLAKDYTLAYNNGRANRGSAMVF
jgi:hypothetical protein